MLMKEQSTFCYVRKYSFSQRTINVWNKLSTDCVHASCVNMFIFFSRIDKYLRQNDLRCSLDCNIAEYSC